MSVQRQSFQPEKLHARIVNGYRLLSPSLSVSGGTRQIFVSGQVSKDINGNVVGKGDMHAQIQQVGENVRMCLEAAGATLADLVRTTTYVTDIDEFFKHVDIRHRYFGPALPTSTTIEVRRLAHADYMVEIEGLAIV
jgi:enamine deaminase RidA (YjgF/YER057c/UK114 family)